MLALRIDGVSDVHPHNVDPALVLGLASAYVDALRAVAQASNLDLVMRGLDIRDRCVEVVFGVNKVGVAREAAQEVSSVLAMAGRPRGATTIFDRLHAALAALPREMAVRIQSGKNWSRQLRAPESGKPTEPPFEILSTSAVPVRAGGIVPAVRFRSDGEIDFTLSGDEDTVRRLGSHLYREVDIEAEISRNADGSIAAGKILNFAVVDTGDAVQAWDRWFAESGGVWDDQSVEALLGRGAD